jgi:23S rRNA (adenine-N6)-dimethyltransferase
MRRSIQFSQNFLHNPRLIERLIGSSSIGPEDTVLDIGAGRGSITRMLADRANEVIAYEMDKRLAERLQYDFANQPYVHVMAGDFMTADLPTKPFKVFANIPFNKTSAIIHKLYDDNPLPPDSYLILQKEAAEKFAGMPGRESLFSVLHKPWFDIQIAYQFKPADFTPEPRIDVVLLSIQLKSEPPLSALYRTDYADFVSYIFNHANPNILPALQALFPGRSFAYLQANFTTKLTARPTQLTIEDWLFLFTFFQQSSTLRETKLVFGTHARIRGESSKIEKYHRTRLSKTWRRDAQA